MAKAKKAPKTPIKPAAKPPGKAVMKGNKTGIPFGQQPQPTPEQKRAGWLKKKRAQELAKAVLELSFKGMKDPKVKREAAAYFGIEPSDLTVEMMLLFRQAQKAIEQSDTYAFNSVMDRAFGKPKEKLEHSAVVLNATVEEKSIDYSKFPLNLRMEMLNHLRSSNEGNVSG